MSKQHYKTEYGKVKVFRPNTHNSNCTVVIIPGYSESITHNKKLVLALINRGIDAFTFSQPRKADKKGLTDPISRQGDIVIKTLEMIMGEAGKVNAVAHSLGCASVLRAAKKSPHKFNSIILMQPLGMAGEQKTSELFRQIRKKSRSNLTVAKRDLHTSYDSQPNNIVKLDKENKIRYSVRIARAQLASAGIISKHPRLALSEARKSSKYNITDDIKQVAALGVPIHLFLNSNDELFDRKKIDRNVELIGDSLCSVQNIEGENSIHDSFWMHPERSALFIKRIIDHPRLIANVQIQKN